MRCGMLSTSSSPFDGTTTVASTFVPAMTTN
jgi:hypothetical protein